MRGGKWKAAEEGIKKHRMGGGEKTERMGGEEVEEEREREGCKGR